MFTAGFLCLLRSYLQVLTVTGRSKVDYSKGPVCSPSKMRIPSLFLGDVGQFQKAEEPVSGLKIAPWKPLSDEI